ncbi:MAG: gamma-glutamyl-gamma-aminobutyrate hydrolase family protein [Candidatus Syntrophonatronum acetioxidans]|uniref:Gamma-glutamyl-gamma-aminobutyrate hydrolase family protein n=1 Tax=Candidatus Syntrophonatronum acetioxidans TaxID=1795816 RepID=A0A424YA53_9FIRM|nr:MAG: gamma-glutamyl-gamma-aminobutyrate hydrolase family protein [Candidatus Syntrophonatronum acetioxidans]
MKKRPLIGITSCHDHETRVNRLALAYTRVLEEAGALPVIIPSLEEREAIKVIIDTFDGLVFSGGGDPDPFLWGEEPLPEQGEIEPWRDQMEILLVKEALEIGTPLLGICRGMQVMNLAAGGTLYQDLDRQKGGLIKHMQEAPRWYATHGVTLTPGSRINNIMGRGNLRVNSFHHQGIAQVAPGFLVSGRAPDEVIEVLEYREGGYALGVQWHPETMVKRDKKMGHLFADFVCACKG